MSEELDVTKMRVRRNPLREYAAIHRSIIADNRLSHATFRVFCFLMSFDPCFPSYKKIMEGTGVGRETVSRALKKLIELQYITYKRGCQKANRANEYQVDGRGKNENPSSTIEPPLVRSSNHPSSIIEPPLVRSSNSKRTIEKNNKNKNEQPPGGGPSDASASACLSPGDLEEAYKKYPRKRGKTAGMKKLKSEIKTKEQYNDLCTAIENYAEECKKYRTPQDKIKHFSTFANNWQDYLEEDLSPRDKAWKVLEAALLEDDWDDE